VEDPGRGHVPIGLQDLEASADLGSAPTRSSSPHLEGGLQDFRVGGVRTGMRPVRSVLKAVRTFVPVPLEPLVAGLPTDPEAFGEPAAFKEATDG
jgi:hypothetical protein